MAEIGAQVCQALTIGPRTQDIIHRDIKPQNIMVQPDGNVKVMDFGIAAGEELRHDARRPPCWAPAHYISPEQAQGRETSPPRATSTRWAWCMYEACTGQLPFDGPDAVSVAMQQVNDLPVPPCDDESRISDPGA